MENVGLTESWEMGYPNNKPIVEKGLIERKLVKSCGKWVNLVKTAPTGKGLRNRCYAFPQYSQNTFYTISNSEALRNE